MSDQIKEGIDMPRYTKLQLSSHRKGFKCESCLTEIPAGGHYWRVYSRPHRVDFICSACKGQ